MRRFKQLVCCLATIVVVLPVAVALGLSVILLAPVSNAWADNITYNIVDYPASQTDLVNGGVAHISGQITTDGTLGPIWGTNTTIPDLVSESFTVTTSTGVTFTGLNSASWFPDRCLFYATETSLLMYDDYYLSLNSSPTSYVEWSRLTIPNWGWVPDYRFSYLQSGGWPGLFWDGGSAVTAPGHIGYNDPWVIATAVPEPSTFVLLGLGAIGLLAYAWRRRRAS